MKEKPYKPEPDIIGIIEWWIVRLVLLAILLDGVYKFLRFLWKN
jgi:hypothetical protein